MAMADKLSGKGDEVLGYGLTGVTARWPSGRPPAAPALRSAAMKAEVARIHIATYRVGCRIPLG